MTPLAMLFMILSWSFVLSLAGWCFHRVLRAKAAGAPGASGSAPERISDRADDPGAGSGQR